MKIYVKKIVSLHPNKYQFIKFDEAIKKYQRYCQNIAISPYATDCKNLDAWLLTEI